MQDAVIDTLGKLEQLMIDTAAGKVTPLQPASVLPEKLTPDRRMTEASKKRLAMDRKEEDRVLAMTEEQRHDYNCEKQIVKHTFVNTGNFISLYH